jgi:hypothetical protein
MTNPVREYRTIIDDSGNPGYVNRILIGIPATGIVRVEWVQARYGQMIPMNWSQVEMYQFLDSYMPMRYEVSDAQNMIVKMALDKDFEWLLLYEHDVLPPPDAFVKLNRWMREATAPVVSGLYFYRSFPSEPLVFRGRGTGVFTDFDLGDVVYCDGVPTGYLLIHMAVLREMWKDSEEYQVKPGIVTRRVFNTPRDQWVDPDSAWVNTTSGTSDLEWCTRIIEGDYLRKAGWGDYVDGLTDARYPFIVDARIFCGHIDNQTGVIYPGVDVNIIGKRQAPPDLGVSVNDGLAIQGAVG